jgi:hypothetical protein
VTAILVRGLKCRTQFWKGTTQGALRSRWPPRPNLSKHRTLCEIHIKIFCSETTGLIATKLRWKSFQTWRFLWEFPIWSYVKLNSAVAAILVGGLKCRMQFWKGTTQGSFQQSLVEIGLISSFRGEEFFFNISHLNVLFRNHWVNCNQTLVEWSLGGTPSKLCPVIPTSSQDGRQAKNRKKGGN